MENIKVEAENNLMSDATDFVSNNDCPNSQELELSQLMSSQSQLLSQTVPAVADEAKTRMQEIDNTDDGFTMINVHVKGKTKLSMISSPVENVITDTDSNASLPLDTTDGTLQALIINPATKAMLFADISVSEKNVC